MNARTCLARSENSNDGTFCGMRTETKGGVQARGGNPQVEHDLVVLVGHPDPPRLVERQRRREPDLRRFETAGERARAHAVVAIVARQPQPVVLVRIEARQLHVDRGADRLLGEHRGCRRPARTLHHDLLGGRTGGAPDGQHDRRDHGCDRHERADADADPADPPAPARNPLLGDASRDPPAERARRLGRRADDAGDRRRRQRVGDCLQVAQLGAAGRATVEVRA